MVPTRHSAGAQRYPARACTRITPDTAYGQFPKTVVAFKAGCDSPGGLQTDLSFDRGFGVTVSSTAPDLGVSMTTLDLFGRPNDTYEPSPDAASPSIVHSAHIDYGETTPLSSVSVTRFTAPSDGGPIATVQLFNGLHEPVLAFEQGDSTWIATGWTERSSSGRVFRSYRPFAAPAGTNPTSVAVGGTAISPAAAGYFLYSTDGFGRQQTVYENSLKVLERTFFPLVVETRDAEQLPGGSHVGSFTRVEYSSLGQVQRVIDNTSAGAELTTLSEYDVLGNVVALSRLGLYSSFVRTQTWDSLGRLVANSEPNTSDIRTGIGWRYAWDDTNRVVGTSDGRGCGKDVYYDGLGRILAEDYSPCVASQADYSAPNLTTGAGFEVQNTYDTYEAGQVASDAPFVDSAVLATGRLVATRDRGAYSRFSYDDHGRTRRVSRRVAKPQSHQIAGADPYAPHWYTSRADFDIADRLTSRTTGADTAPFVPNGSSKSAEMFGYSARGLLKNINSSHGVVLNAISYEVDGQISAISYGDLAATRAALTYDVRRQLKTYALTRTAPALWAAASTAHYVKPDWTTTQTNLASFDFSQRDLVGNPLVLDDTSPAAQWPTFAAPVRQRRMTYDDRYRTTSVQSGYVTTSGVGAGTTPYLAEIAAGDRRPIPLQALTTRVASQTFDYDFLGNVTSSTDDQSATYDRSLGAITNGDGGGAAGWGPNQLRAASGITAAYDEAGNLIELKIERPGGCVSSIPLATIHCGQWFVYEWDEVGQLAHAQRWDFPGSLPAALPTTPPEWDLRYAYAGGSRVVKTSKAEDGTERHSLEVFGSLRFERDTFDEVAGDYARTPARTHLYLGGGVGHAFADTGTLPAPVGSPAVRMFLTMRDHVGSATVTIDATTSEVVERATFQPFGAMESDYRPDRWGDQRELYKFTGKEEDIEVGATYFGARYYQPHLGRFMSADPLAVHGMGGDLNPYAYVRGRVMTHVDPLGFADEPAEAAADSAGGLQASEGPDPPENSIQPADDYKAGPYISVFSWINQSSAPPNPSGEADQSWTVPPSAIILTGLDARQASSSAGGTPTITTASTVLTFPRATLGNLYPDVARRLAANERQDFVVAAAPFLLIPLTGGLSSLTAEGGAVAAAEEGASGGGELFTVRRFLGRDELRQLRKEGVQFDPEKGSGIPTTTRNFSPQNQDIARARIGARNAAYWVDLDVTGVPRGPTTVTRSGLPEYPMQGDLLPNMIIEWGRVPK